MSNVLKKPLENRDHHQKLDREIDRVAAAIQRFRVEGQRFFAGDRKLPPDDLRERIAADLRRLRGANRKGAAANFRLGTLEAQFQSHLDLYGRRLRRSELGSLRPSAGEAGRLDPEKGVVFGLEGNTAAVQALYESFHRRNPRMDADRFGAYLERQAEAIRAKTGCSEIQFRVAEQGGKMKLKAKPIRRQS